MQERSKAEAKVVQLQDQKQFLQAENFSLREQIESLESEQKTHQLVMAEMQAALEERSRECEAKMRSMQQEVSSRLDEINVNRTEDKEKMNLEYAALFDEKAAELLLVREEISGKDTELDRRERRISELEYRETELNETITRLRDNYDPGIYKRTQQLVEQCSNNTALLQAKLNNITAQHETSKSQYSDHIKTLTKEICDMKNIIDTKDKFIQKISQINQFNQENLSNILEKEQFPNSAEDLDNTNKSDDNIKNKDESIRESERIPANDKRSNNHDNNNNQNNTSKKNRRNRKKCNRKVDLSTP